MSEASLLDRDREVRSAALTRAVLIVDDDEIIRRLLSERLATRGFRPIAAGDGAEALRLLSEHRPALVVTDYHMPGMKGVELVRRMLAFDPDLRIVVVSGYASLPTVIEAMKAGAVDFLSKPLDLESLIRALA